MRIGRDDANDVVLNNDSVSGFHAQIQLQRDGTFVVTDLNSLNGVAVNDEQLDVGNVVNGDVVEIGEVRFRFVVS